MAAGTSDRRDGVGAAVRAVRFAGPDEAVAGAADAEADGETAFVAGAASPGGLGAGWRREDREITFGKAMCLWAPSSPRCGANRSRSGSWLAESHGNPLRSSIRRNARRLSPSRPCQPRLATSSRSPLMDFTGYRKIASTCPISVSMPAELGEGVMRGRAARGSPGQNPADHLDDERPHPPRSRDRRPRTHGRRCCGIRPYGGAARRAFPASRRS
jgi:hypothetical protein